MEADELAEALKGLTYAVQCIAHGDASGPGGLEALAMAVEGQAGHGQNPLSDAIRDGQHEIAEALREGLESIADAITKSGRNPQ